MDIFENRGKTLPVWFMRQAGRYHSHYQGIKKNSDFMTMCKNPELATEVTLGPIQDFGFNAAILFSDLLFKLLFSLNNIIENNRKFNSSSISFEPVPKFFEET